MINLKQLQLPKRLYSGLKARLRQSLERSFFRQGFTKIRRGSFVIEAPDNHILVRLLKSQPYRDLCVGMAAKHISAKYPDGVIVDVGANIGDTAAIIATYSPNKLILLEASDYFFDILLRNTLQLHNEKIVRKVMVSDGNQVSGFFRHQDGSASLCEEADGKLQIKTERLCDIADYNTVFIKTDTDGYDFKIISDSLEWLASVHPAVLFENEIRTGLHLQDSNDLCARLMEIGYAYFIVWDDPGFHLVSTDSLEVIKDLNRYLFKVWQHEGPRSICNYDVLCLHHNDKDVYKNMCEWCRTY